MENQVANHLLRLEMGSKVNNMIINDSFPIEQHFYIMYIDVTWYIYFSNDLQCGVLPLEESSLERKIFLHDAWYFL